MGQLMSPLTELASRVSHGVENTSHSLGSIAMMSDKGGGSKKKRQRGGNLYKKCGQLIRRRGMEKRKRASRKRGKK